MRDFTKEGASENRGSWDLRRIHEELRKLNLDWNAPPFPAEAAGTEPVAKPLRISIAETVSPEP